MALEQRKFQTAYVPAPERTETAPKQAPIRRPKKYFSIGEKFLFVLFSAILVVIATMILHSQSQIIEVNREVQSLSFEIEELQKQNSELSIQVSEKSTYKRIWEKAKELGFQHNEENVKVVPGR